MFKWCTQLNIFARDFPRPHIACTQSRNSGADMDSNAVFYVTIKGAVRASGLSRSTIYEHIAAGRIIARKAGVSTLVDAGSLRAFLDSLPPARIVVRHRRPTRAAGANP